MTRLAIATAILLTGTSLASSMAIDADIASFVHADKFTPADAYVLELGLDTLWLDTTNVSPGGKVGPLEKAMIIAAGAIPSTRTRTAISYGELIKDDGPVSFIEVRHYNLGPALHDQAVQDYGAENTADLAEFGEGNHMAWRFVFQPLMNNAAILMDASSRVISPKEASRQDCNGRPCLDPYAEPEVEWQAMDGTLPTWPDLYPATPDAISAPAHAIAQLAILGFWANAESGTYQWTGGEHPEAIRDTTPYSFITIDRNLGQDDGIDATWRETRLMDDAISAISFRLVNTGQVHLMSATEPW